MHRVPHRHLFKKDVPRLAPIYAASIFLAIHTFLVAYMNSSYLAQFVSSATVGVLYTLGSALTVIVFMFISRVLHLVGNFKLTFGLLLTTFIAVVGMAFADTLRLAVPLFLALVVIAPLLIFNLDVFIEEFIGNDESSTGSKRGLLLAILSFIGAIAPFVGGVAVGDSGNFTYAYLLSAFSLLPIMLVLIFFLRDFSDPPYNEIKPFSAFRAFWVRKNVRNVFLAHFALQMFFMAMVIYAPLYLTGTIGLSWTEFGIVMFCAQMAYVLLEYPIGIVADRYIGEKEMMVFGFMVIALSTASISFVSQPNLMLWCILFFITRVGASFVEATTESYFFKQTKSSDAQVISFFRVTRPLAYLLGALISSLVLLYIPFNLLFVVIAFIMIPAMFFTLALEDSK